MEIFHQLTVQSTANPHTFIDFPYPLGLRFLPDDGAPISHYCTRIWDGGVSTKAKDIKRHNWMRRMLCISL